MCWLPLVLYWEKIILVRSCKWLMTFNLRLWRKCPRYAKRNNKEFLNNIITCQLTQFITIKYSNQRHLSFMVFSLSYIVICSYFLLTDINHTEHNWFFAYGTDILKPNHIISNVILYTLTDMCFILIRNLSLKLKNYIGVIRSYFMLFKDMDFRPFSK